MTSAKIVIIGLGFLSLESYARTFERKIRTIHRERPSFHVSWIQLASDTQEALKYLSHVMSLSPTGKKILIKAKQKAGRDGLNLSEVLFAGEKSYTDITLVRQFFKYSSERIHYQTRSRVFINRNLNVQDAVMDMAHELIHYATRDDFNPYRKNFNLKHFILSTIEGRGGEVDAYMAECKVFFELFSRPNPKQTHCHLIRDSRTKKIIRSKATALFYRLGSHYKPFLDKIKQHNIQPSFKKIISSQQNLLTSATYDLPYPLAAIHEYESIMKKTCENERKRINTLPQNNVSFTLLEAYRKRCSLVLNQY